MSENQTDGSPSESSSIPATASVVGVARGLLRQRRFLLAATVLLICAIGFNTATRALQLHFRKLPVPLAVKALDDKVEGLPLKIQGRWLAVGDDQPLNADVEKALGTKQYVNRTYVDLRAARKSELDFKGRDARRIADLVREIKQTKPEAVVQLGFTYYTGLVDTVAHIPDRCMVADGYQPTSYVVKPGPTTYADAKGRPVSFRYITFEDITGQSRVTRNVGYFFHVNGEYENDPLGVRFKLQNLFETYGYYSKIEMMTEQFGKADDEAARARSAEAMSRFLSDLLPEVERCLPDWNKVKNGQLSSSPPGNVAAEK